MRMWNINPQYLCDQHLLGEHVEMHMFAGCILKDISLEGYIKGGLVELDKLTVRHNILAEEMVNRGMNHQSIYPSIDTSKFTVKGIVNKVKSIRDLTTRCLHCREIYFSLQARGIQYE